MVTDAFDVVLVEALGAAQALVIETIKNHQRKRAACGEKCIIGNFLLVWQITREV
jgi:hypothetical protein